MYYYQCLYHTSIIQVSTYQNIGKYLDSETPIYFVGLISKGVLKRLFFCFLCQPGEPEIAAKMFNSQYTPLTWLKKVVTFLKTDRKWMSLYKWPLYDHFWPFFCHMCVYLSQNVGSDSHFEVLNGSKSWLGLKLWPQT